MRHLERTDVFIGCCVDHAAGHGEWRPVPLMSHYLHIIPASMILRCSGATKITDFSNTSEIALGQLQKCSNAAQYASSIEGKLRRLSGGNTRRRNERSSGRRYSSRFFGLPAGFFGGGGSGFTFERSIVIVLPSLKTSLPLRPAQKQLFWGNGIRGSEARTVKHLREQRTQGFWALLIPSKTLRFPLPETSQIGPGEVKLEYQYQ